MFLHSISETKNKGIVLVVVIGMLIIVALLTIAVVMVSISENLMANAKKRNLKALYGAEAQIKWAALKLKEDPFYSGGVYEGGPSYPSAVYKIDGAETIKIIVEPGPGDWSAISPSSTTWYRVKAYVKFGSVLGKVEPAARVDATIVRNIDADSGTVTTEIKDWEEIRPPRDPEEE